MRLPLLALILGLLCACSSTPSSAPAVAEYPASPDAVTVVFFRDRCPPILIKGALQIDGVPRAVLGVENYAVVRLAPGRHELKYAFPFWAGTPSRKLTIEAKPGTTRYFYFTTAMGFVGLGATIVPQLHEISPGRGQPLMASFKAVPLSGP